jgi:hypothetical protein
VRKKKLAEASIAAFSNEIMQSTSENEPLKRTVPRRETCTCGLPKVTRP